MEAYTDMWAQHTLVDMHPVPLMTKLGYDGKSVDSAGRRLKHAPQGDWIIPASKGAIGLKSWLVDKGIPLGSGTGLTVVALGLDPEMARTNHIVCGPSALGVA